MITVTWKGKAVSVNRWHVVRRGRIYPSREYEGFIADLAEQIWAQVPLEERSGLPWKTTELRAICSVGNAVDHHNLVKPVCDALKHARVIEDDREIRRVDFEVKPAHCRRELDEITLTIRKAMG